MAKQEKKTILSSNHFPVVGIGASAGGLEAFKKLILSIQPRSGMAYVLVQHLDPSHQSMLPELLQRITAIPVIEISDEIKVEPDHIYIIPSNKMLVANDGVLQLSPRPAKSKREQNLPIDLFFTSLAAVHQAHAIGVVLSGTASDGTKGLKAIKEHGGITIAQSKESAAYDGMPHSAIQAGVVDFVLPPEEIPQKLLEITKILDGKVTGTEDLPQPDPDVFNNILALLRVRKGTEFTYYKQTTIRRRILRRMALNQFEETGEYLTFLRENKDEQDVLYQDLLIPVTAFFRDPKTFNNLCKTIFPSLVKNIKENELLRIWVAGCSTGEEAYSMAICLKEFIGNAQERVQLFATDISEPAIAKARAGIYSKDEVAGVSDKRLKEYFTKVSGRFQVNKQVREMCVFALHNFLQHPPFGKMDLISCRNVLIYMEPYLQKKALTTFHYSLTEKGFLLLGKSETISSVPELFRSATKDDKIFTRKDVPGKFMRTTSSQSERGFTAMDLTAKPVTEKPGYTDFQKTADEIMLSKYTPPGVVVNADLDIVHFRGKTGKFLEQLPGKPSHNILKQAKNGLAFELRNILHKVKKTKATVVKENIPLQADGFLASVTIEAIPLPDTIEPHYLILFYDSNTAGNAQSATKKTQKAAGKSNIGDKNSYIQQLEQELAQTREDMRSITEDQEAANEELQSANEELLSSGEELQSLNEELETGKEELQSTNEELSVVNQEIIGLNEQISAARDYAENIIANLRESLVVLDKNLMVVTANKSFYRTFRVNEHETENVLIYDLGNAQWNIPALRELLEKIIPAKKSFNDFEVTHFFSQIGERTMLLNARIVVNEKNKEKLILLSIEDITEKKKAQEIVDEANIRLQQLIKDLPAGVYSCDAEGRINFYNEAAAKLWGRKPKLGKDKWCGSWKIYTAEGLPLPLDQCPMAITIKEGRAIVGEELIIERADGGRSNVMVYPQPQFSLSGELTGAINMVFDITELANANKQILQSQEQFRKDLEEKVQQRTIELSEANTELQKKNKELESFTHISSHDLQEPLRKIQTFTNSILSSEAQHLSDKGMDYFNRIRHASGRMQTLLEDLLMYSRSSASDREFEEISLNHVVEEAINELAEVIKEKTAIITTGELCPAKINAFQFRQVMINLIGNALKFARKNEVPYISITSRILEKHQVEEKNPSLVPGLLSHWQRFCHIRVSDNGIGFDPAYSEQIFEVFERLYGKDEYPGTGIGLAIVKKIVTNHDGFIVATGIINKGASFDIYIPHEE